MENAYLYGAGGHAKVIIDILQSKQVDVKAIFDDNENLKETLGIPVVQGKVKYPLIVSIGNNIVRKKIVEQQMSAEYATGIAASATVSKSATIGCGTVVMQGAIVQAAVSVGEHAIINTGATVDHDCVIGDFVHISPNATLCGAVTVGEGTHIGAGAIIIPGIKIGRWSVIGAGSIVSKDIPDNVVAVGSPCRIIKKIENL